MIRLLIHDRNRAGSIEPARGQRHFDGMSSIVRSTPLESAGRSSSTRVSNNFGSALTGAATYRVVQRFRHLESIDADALGEPVGVRGGGQQPRAVQGDDRERAVVVGGHLAQRQGPSEFVVPRVFLEQEVMDDSPHGPAAHLVDEPAPDRDAPRQAHVVHDRREARGVADVLHPLEIRLPLRRKDVDTEVARLWGADKPEPALGVRGGAATAEVTPTFMVSVPLVHRDRQDHGAREGTARRAIAHDALDRLRRAHGVLEPGGVDHGAHADRRAVGQRQLGTLEPGRGRLEFKPGHYANFAALDRRAGDPQGHDALSADPRQAEPALTVGRERLREPRDRWRQALPLPRLVAQPARFDDWRQVLAGGREDLVGGDGGVRAPGDPPGRGSGPRSGLHP